MREPLGGGLFEMSVLPDILRENLALVICGSAVGERSASLGHYYAGIGNKFWRVLAETGLTPLQLQPSQASDLLNHGIGLTDLVKSQSGSDHSIRFNSAAADELRTKILRYKPRFLCFNGKRPAQAFFGKKGITYGLQNESIEATAIFVAPSTSGAANGSWNPMSWQEIARRVQRSKAAT